MRWKGEGGREGGWTRDGCVYYHFIELGEGRKEREGSLGLVVSWDGWSYIPFW